MMAGLGAGFYWHDAGMRCHPRYAGMACVPHWIPAFAGMTTGAAVWHLSGMAKGLLGWQAACFLFVVIPAEAGIHLSSA